MTPNLSALPGEPAADTHPLAAVAFVAFAALGLFVIGWFSPAVVTRVGSTDGFRTWVGEAFGNAPTAGRIVVGRVR